MNKEFSGYNYITPENMLHENYVPEVFFINSDLLNHHPVSGIDMLIHTHKATVYL